MIVRVGVVLRRTVCHDIPSQDYTQSDDHASLTYDSYDFWV